MLTLDVEPKVRAARRLLDSSASAELRALGHLLLGPQHLEVRLFAKVEGLFCMVLAACTHRVELLFSVSALKRASEVAWGMWFTCQGSRGL